MRGMVVLAENGRRLLNQINYPSPYEVLLSVLAARSLLLNGRARNTSVRTEHTAITGLGAKQFAAAGAVVKELAGIGGHGLGSLMTAMRTR